MTAVTGWEIQECADYVVPDQVSGNGQCNGLAPTEGDGKSNGISSSAEKAFVIDEGCTDNQTNGCSKSVVPEPPKQVVQGTTIKPGAPEQQRKVLNHYLSNPGKESSAMAFLKEVFGLEIKSLEECHNAFCEIDEDHSGQLGPEEFMRMLQNMGCEDVNEHDLKVMISRIDTDHDECISFNEFLEALSESDQVERGATALERKIRKLSSDMQKKMEEKRMSPQQRAFKSGVLQSNIIKYLEEEIAEATACQQLPWCIMLLTTFTLSFVTHFRPSIMHGINQSIKYDIKNNANFGFGGNIPFETGRMGHKDMDTVGSVAEFWSWLDLGLMPLLYREANYLSEQRDNIFLECSTNTTDTRHGCTESGPGMLSLERRTQYMLRNRIIGGVRLRQERAKSSSCEGDFPYAQIGRCHPSQYSGYRAVSPETVHGFQQELSYSPQFFPTLMPLAKISSQLHHLEDNFWISEATQRVEVSFCSYHPQENVLTMTYINFYFSYGGRIWKSIKLASVPLDPYNRASMIIDIFWQGQVLLALLFDIRDVIWVIRHSSSCWHGVKAYASVWKFVNWLNTSCGVVALLLFLRWSNLVRVAKALLFEAHPTIEGSWAQVSDRSAFFIQMDTICLSWYEYRMFLMFYVFVIGSRFFEAFNAQPRLSMVTKTLYRSLVDLFHFGIVFMAIFLLFSVAGVVIFAGEIPGFTDVGHASYVMWRLILGDNTIVGVDFDDAYEGMRKAGEVRAMVWNFGFAFLIYFLLLNMILAIVLDWYTEVRGAVGAECETIWSQAAEIFRRVRDKHKGKFVPLSQIVLALDPTVDDEDDSAEDPLLMVDTLVSKVPRLTWDQAADIIGCAAEYTENQKRDGASLSDAGNKIESLSETILDLHAQVQALVMLTTVITDAQMTELKSTKKVMEHLGASKDRDASLPKVPPTPDFVRSGSLNLKVAPRDFSRRSAPAGSLADSAWAIPDIAVENQKLLHAKQSSLTWRRDVGLRP